MTDSHAKPPKHHGDQPSSRCAGNEVEVVTWQICVFRSTPVCGSSLGLILGISGRLKLLLPFPLAMGSALTLGGLYSNGQKLCVAGLTSSSSSIIWICTINSFKIKRLESLLIPPPSNESRS